MTTQITRSTVECVLRAKTIATEITNADVERFTYGSCYQLAEAISSATGWPMYAFWDDFIQDYDIHAFVRTPRGTFLDITGEHSRYRMLRQWDGLHIRKIRDSYNIRSWDFGNPFFDSTPRAQQLVPVLLAEYNNRSVDDSVRVSERKSA